MKVLFLDFDGVLNFYGAEGTMRDGAPWWSHPEDIRMPFEPRCIGLLNDIYAATGCSIVVSSSWRLTKMLEQLQRSLEWYGCEAPVIGVTPDLVNEYLNRETMHIDTFGDRGFEIEAYLVRNPEVTEFVILDDCSDMGRLLPCLVKTHPMVGLTVEDAAEAIGRFKLSPFYARLVRAV